MKTESHSIVCIDGTYVVQLDIYTMDGVEAVEAYELPSRAYSNGGFRIEALINGMPAGTHFYSGNLGSTYYGDGSDDAAREILAEARRNGILPAVIL